MSILNYRKFSLKSFDQCCMPSGLVKRALFSLCRRRGKRDSACAKFCILIITILYLLQDEDAMMSFENVIIYALDCIGKEGLTLKNEQEEELKARECIGHFPLAVYMVWEISLL